MVTIELDHAHIARLEQLARSKGQDASAVARQIVVDFLDFQLLPEDRESDWAEASVALSPEVMGLDSWNEDDSHGSK